MEKRFYHGPQERGIGGIVGPNRKTVFGNIQIHPERLDIPLRRKKPTVWAVWNDLFHEDVPDDFIMRVFDSMPTDFLQPCKHTYLILTKRVKRMHQFFDERTRYGTRPWTNVWLGVTVCNQEEADQKIPLLLQIPAAVRWVSIEPMLGAADLLLPGKNFTFSIAWGSQATLIINQNIHWVVLGGETGPGARPMHPDWVRSVRDQCQAAQVPFFFKQWGEWAWSESPEMEVFRRLDRFKLYRFKEDGTCMYRIGRKAAGRLLDGREWNELPEVYK